MFIVRFCYAVGLEWLMKCLFILWEVFPDWKCSLICLIDDIGYLMIIKE